MKHNDGKETDIRMSAEKSKERSIEKSKEKGKETNTEKNTDYRKKSHEMDMLNGSLAIKMLIFAMPLAASSILRSIFIRLMWLWQEDLREVMHWQQLEVMLQSLLYL